MSGEASKSESDREIHRGREKTRGSEGLPSAAPAGLANSLGNGHSDDAALHLGVEFHAALSEGPHGCRRRLGAQIRTRRCPRLMTASCLPAAAPPIFHQSSGTSPQWP